MIFLFPVKNVIRCSFVVCLSFFFSVLQAQEIDPDAALVQQASNEVLDKRVDVSWSGGLLPQLLKKLNAEHQVIFSYANNRIKHIQLPSFQFSAAKLSQVLDKAFDRSGYTYVLVGQIVAVVKVPNTQSAEKGSDSTTTSKQKKAPAPNHLFHKIQPRQVSQEELRILNQIYGKEIKRMARIRERNETKTDTLKKPEQKDKTQEMALTKSDSRKFFVSAGFGLNVRNQGIRINNEYDWLKEMDFQYKTSYSVLPQVAVGIKIKHFLFSMDMRYQTIKQTFTWTETIKKGPPDDPPPPESEREARTETDKFTAISIQFMLTYLVERNKWFGGLGIGPSFQIISSDKKTSKLLKKTFEKNQKKEKYEEQYSSLLTGFQLKAMGGYHLTPKLSLSAELGYLAHLQPVYSNSIYSFGLTALCLQGRMIFWI